MNTFSECEVCDEVKELQDGVCDACAPFVGDHAALNPHGTDTNTVYLTLLRWKDFLFKHLRLHK